LLSIVFIPINEIIQQDTIVNMLKIKLFIAQVWIFKK